MLFGGPTIPLAEMRLIPRAALRYRVIDIGQAEITARKTIGQLFVIQPQ